MSPVRILKEFRFSTLHEIGLLNDCLKATEVYLNRDSGITKGHLNELAGWLADALIWGEQFGSRKTWQQIKDIVDEINCIDRIMTNISIRNNCALAIHSLKSAKRSLEFEKGSLIVGRLRRHIPPYIHLNRKSGQPSIERINSYLIKLATQIGEEPGEGLMKINDTKSKPFHIFFHSASIIINHSPGKKVFLGFVYDMIYRRFILGKPPTGKNPETIYINNVQGFIYKARHISGPLSVG